MKAETRYGIKWRPKVDPSAINSTSSTDTLYLDNALGYKQFRVTPHPSPLSDVKSPAHSQARTSSP